MDVLKHWLTMMNDDEKRQRAIALNNYAPLNDSFWSSYVEVTQAVDYLLVVLKEQTELKGKGDIVKKHIQVLMLNLYSVWSADADRYVTFYRRVNEYKAKDNRYNKQRISKKIIEVVDCFEQLGFLIQVKGFYARDGERQSKITRIRATDVLINIVKDKHNITPEMIERVSNQESVILRDYDEERKRQVNVQYDDSDETNIMRHDLCAYNNLLHRTYIDIPDLDTPRIETSDGQFVRISQHDKFVRRIFSNASFDEGGRYYGGWWQRIPSKWREKIEIWGARTAEVDYSGLHIVLLYSYVGIDYWDAVNKDPYRLEGYETSRRMRGLMKLILLIAINCDSKVKAVGAVNLEINHNMENMSWVREMKYSIADIIDDFAERHKPIQEYFFSGAGIKLQNIDSIIAEYVVNEFTKSDVVVLCIHDSFIVSNHNMERLKELMDTGFRRVVNEIGVEPDVIETTGTGLKIKWYEPINKSSYRIEGNWIDKYLNVPFMGFKRGAEATLFKFRTNKDYYIIDE